MFAIYDDWFAEVNAAFDELRKDARSCYQGSFPPMNVFVEDDGSLNLEFALAGYSKEEVSVQFAGDVITLSAEKKKDEKKKENYALHGIRSSNFKNRYTVPNGKFDLTNASGDFKDGILRIILPATPNAKPRTLTFK